MKLAVVAYPVMDTGSMQIIESFRSANDPLATFIAAHFTLVFPVEADEDALAAELRRIARETPPIDFRLAGVTVSVGIDGRSYIFLEPDAGRSGIDALHTRVYEGLLAPHLRRDVGFVPHMTFGSGEDAACRESGEQLRDSWVPVDGRIEALTVVDLSGECARSHEVFPLGG
jgi:2'-5' RNA ligase